ncbi:MAG: pantoate--beta-alanine ligase [Bacteroidetes bacterium 4572_77]|nr:MAG: pantoate--beta-alanine ligase [Bacteroidetes bacterium 4572_77]
MIIYKKIAALKTFLESQRNDKKTIGFVPTMGALHQGHISLVEAAKKENDIVVVSIFVNPIQFNKAEDLEKYPRTLEEDCRLLEGHCQAVFYPSVEEMYPEEVKKNYDFGELATVMEGACRPGHFNGVGVVVKKLFDIVEAHKAYFGKKDFQQLAIIRRLVEIESIPITIVACATEREIDGLAMSSRNRRLSQKERGLAPQIYKGLSFIKERKEQATPLYLQQEVLVMLQKYFDTEYIQIVDGYSLQSIQNWEDTDYPVVCVAANLGSVRLIDNLEL